MAGRVTQTPTEVALLPSTQEGRVSQTPVEVALVPTTQKGRVTQTPVEVALTLVPLARATQIVVEVIIAAPTGTPFGPLAQVI